VTDRVVEEVRRYIRELQSALGLLQVEQIEQAIDLLHQARLKGRRVFLMGNGGSAATASHFVCDLAKGTRKKGWPDFCVIGLADNMAVLTAYANDDGYDQVFSQQLRNLGRAEDVVVAFSASGNSKNVLEAIRVARQIGATTIGFTGFDGGALASMVDHNVHVPSPRIEQVEDIHLALEHLICTALRCITEPQPAERLPAQPSETAELQPVAVPAIAVIPTEGPRRNWLAKEGVHLLYQVSDALSKPLDIQGFLHQVMGLIMGGVRASSGSIILLTEQGEVVEGALGYGGIVSAPKTESLSEVVEHGLAGWVVSNREPALVPNTSIDPRWLRRPWEGPESISRSAICVPLVFQDKVMGVLTLAQPGAGRFSDEDLMLIAAVAVCLSQVACRLPAFIQAEESAFRDVD
jgi:D-sedoheptulose 7-phosphate isomerase